MAGRALIWSFDRVETSIAAGPKRVGKFDRQTADTFRGVFTAPSPDSLRAVKSEVVGLLFVRPEHALARDEIIPHLEYFHHRSAESIDFYCIGYGASFDGVDDTVIVDARTAHEWAFSSLAFVRCVRDVEARSTWEYGGGPEVMLLPTHVNRESGHVTLDFGYVVAIDLQCALAEKVIVSVTHLFESIVHSVNDQDLEAWSDSQVVRAFLKGVGEELLAKLPLGLGKAGRRASQFLVRDFSR